MEQLTKSLQENRAIMDEKIGAGKNFDVITRDLEIGGKEARLYVLDGYGDDKAIERILSFLLQVESAEMEQVREKTLM